MNLWRLCRRPHADLSGEGARRLGGRWNSPGRPVVYMAEHPALAALEVRVHLDLPFDLLPADFVLVRIALPDRLATNLDRIPPETISHGDAWLMGARSAALRVPSVLIPHSWNVLLNPRHSKAGQARVLTIEPFGFDPRLWQNLANRG
jgi:RES domain-containing protein